MSQKHLFIIDPVEKLNLKLDSSLKLAFELFQKGHEVYETTSSGLYWNISSRVAAAKVRKLSFSDDSSESVSFLKEEKKKLSTFQAIHMRKEPPFNNEYISVTWMLDTVREKVKIYNDPRALRAINEKLSIFMFPEYADKALLSSNVDDLFDFINKEAGGDAIIKPLDLFGGRGVERLNIEELGEDKLRVALDEMTKNGTEARLVQPFNKEIFNGEIRVFTLGGEALSWCLKRPLKGEYMANTGRGAILEEYEPTAKQKAMVKDMAETLSVLGADFLGFDIIGNYVSEINITSPRLLQADTDNTNYYRTIAEWVEKNSDGLNS